MQFDDFFGLDNICKSRFDDIHSVVDIKFERLLTRGQKAVRNVVFLDINQQLEIHNRKSHDFDSHEGRGAKVKGVEETAVVEADSLNSMGWTSSADPVIWELRKVGMQSQIKQGIKGIWSQEGFFVCCFNFCTRANECEMRKTSFTAN